MYRMNKERMRCLRWSLLAILLSVIISACAGMEIIPLTSETFPPKSSMGDVKILSEEPDRQYKKLAEITIADSKKKGWKLQHMILQKAAEMGADVVVFADRQATLTSIPHTAPCTDPGDTTLPITVGTGVGILMLFPPRIRRNGPR